MIPLGLGDLLMPCRMDSGLHPGANPARTAWFALCFVLANAEAGATVFTSEPSPWTIANSDVICLARIERIVGAGPLTNKTPPDAIVTVLDGIKGVSRGEELRVVGWEPRAPRRSYIIFDELERQAGRRDPKTFGPPAIRSHVLLFLKRTGQHAAQPIDGGDGPVFMASPDARAIEFVRGSVWLDFAVEPIPEVKSPHERVAIRGAITNRSSDSLWFDPGHTAVTFAHMPTRLRRGESWQPHPPPAIRLGPGERRECSWDVEALAALPIGVPGRYGFGFLLPANMNGQGMFLTVDFRIEGETSTWDATAASWAILAASVEEIIPTRPDRGTRSGLLLRERRDLLGMYRGRAHGKRIDVDWSRAPHVRAVSGGRYIFFLDREQDVFHVEEITPESLHRVWVAMAWARLAL